MCGTGKALLAEYCQQPYTIQRSFPTGLSSLDSSSQPFALLALHVPGSVLILGHINSFGPHTLLGKNPCLSRRSYIQMGVTKLKFPTWEAASPQRSPMEEISVVPCPLPASTSPQESKHSANPEPQCSHYSGHMNGRTPGLEVP